MINLLCAEHGLAIITVHHDNGAASEIRIHDLPGHLEIVTEIATSVAASVTVDGAQTVLDEDR
ncbi:hypothetical protein AB0346_00605 [Nocardia beijingensis]|uniref:hypothetical protein n=1 Tax=Nocardia beijingensis TaxID=95162 RepID=UPI00344BFDBE